MTQTAVETLYRWLASLHPDESDRSTRITLRARAKMRRASKHWMNPENVSGFGLGTKEVAGRNTGHPVLQVFVRRKIPGSRLRAPMIPAVMRLPHSGELIATDVIEQRLGVPHRLSCSAGDGIRREFEGTAPGTLGCFVRSPSSREYALTCWHVAADRGGRTGAVVGWCDEEAGRFPNPRMGKLDRYVKPDRPVRDGVVRDVSLVQLDAAVSTSNLWRAGTEIRGARKQPVAVGEQLNGFGFGSKRIRTGRVRNPRAVVDLKYAGAGSIRFVDAIVTNAMSAPGDSGSVAVDQHGRGVGIVVGGDDRPVDGWTLLVPLKPILDHFDVTLSDSPETLTNGFAALRSGAELQVGDSVSAIDKLARTVWGEAEGETQLGKTAVANVVINRAKSGNTRRFGANVEKVCTMNNGRVWQFSCWDPSDNRVARCMAVDTRDENFVRCLEIARRAIALDLGDVTEGSLHYHADSVSPYWSRNRSPVVTIGRHWFYNDIR